MQSNAHLNRWPSNGLGILAMALLGYALCDLLHEFSHAAATLLPLGVKAVTLSTIGLSSTGSNSALVAAAGPVLNLLLALAMPFALRPALRPSLRYFAWLLGTVNLFNGTAYFIYSAVLGTGDWATVFNAVAAPSLWRPWIGLIGVLAYCASISAASRTLGRLCTDGVVASAHAARYCQRTYWAGGLLITLGAALNPVSPWFILSSGVATGFGAMAGLLLVPTMLSRHLPPTQTQLESVHVGWIWIASGIATAVIFVGVFGPGVSLGS